MVGSVLILLELKVLFFDPLEVKLVTIRAAMSIDTHLILNFIVVATLALYYLTDLSSVLRIPLFCVACLYFTLHSVEGILKFILAAAFVGQLSLELAVHSICNLYFLVGSPQLGFEVLNFAGVLACANSVFLQLTLIQLFNCLQFITESVCVIVGCRYMWVRGRFFGEARILG